MFDFDLDHITKLSLVPQQILMVLFGIFFIRFSTLIKDLRDLVLILNFNIRLKNKMAIDKVLKNLHKHPGILEVHAVRSKNDLDF